jgi:hypothetical protein
MLVLSTHINGDERRDLPAGLQDGPGGHRVEEAQRALQVGAVAGLAEDQE